MNKYIFVPNLFLEELLVMCFFLIFKGIFHNIKVAYRRKKNYLNANSDDQTPAADKKNFFEIREK